MVVLRDFRKKVALRQKPPILSHLLCNPRLRELAYFSVLKYTVFLPRCKIILIWDMPSTEESALFTRVCNHFF